MDVRLVPHKEAQDRTNHVNVHGQWRLLARVCNFRYSKIITFKYMSIGKDLNVKEANDDVGAGVEALDESTNNVPNLDDFDDEAGEDLYDSDMYSVRSVSDGDDKRQFYQ
ncbi:hypothetical protein Tco_0845598 [Tanacetum coccineum]